MAAALLSRMSSVSGFRTACLCVQRRFNPCILISGRLFSQNVTDPPYLGPLSPNYKVRENEPVDMKRGRLLYQSRKRGVSENGLLLSTFAHQYLQDFDDTSLEMYDKIINQPSNDWDLYYWMTGHRPTPDEYDNAVMDKLKVHAKNENKEVRLQQPDLEEKART